PAPARAGLLVARRRAAAARDRRRRPVPPLRRARDRRRPRGDGVMQPPSEHVHWMFATGFLFLALCLVARAIVGPEVWDRRRWRAYLWPGLVFFMGLMMWPVMV